MTENRQRDLKKAQVLQEIQQQRLDMKDSVEDWIESTLSFDKTWNTLFRAKNYFIAGAIVLALFNLRHPQRLVKISQGTASAINSLDLVRRFLT